MIEKSKRFSTGHICKLRKNGKFHRYGYAAAKKTDYDEYPVRKYLKYVGYGIIYSIDGVKQGSKELFHFWILK